MMRVLITISLLILAACENENYQGVWKERDTGLFHYSEFVELGTGRIVVQIMHHEGPEWSVYKNGGGYGEFDTQDHAKRFAEQRWDLHQVSSP